jgi:hypothetical protein
VPEHHLSRYCGVVWVAGEAIQVRRYVRLHLLLIETGIRSIPRRRVAAVAKRAVVGDVCPNLNESCGPDASSDATVDQERNLRGRRIGDIDGGDLGSGVV